LEPETKTREQETMPKKFDDDSSHDEFEANKKLQKDLRTAAELLGQREVRSLVDLYYQTQHYRISCASQMRSSTGDEPSALIEWLKDQSSLLELNLKSSLLHFSSSYYVGQWMQSICGIGPVISSGMLAMLDARDVRTPCAFWSFAGLDPSKKWFSAKVVEARVDEVFKEHKSTKPTDEIIDFLCKEMSRKKDTIVKFASTRPNGEKVKLTKRTLCKALSRRPWNAHLKCLAVFKLGESFVKVQSNEKDFYGKLFRSRRDLEEEKNEALHFKQHAEKILVDKNYGKDTDAYKAYIQGKFPPAHLHARARRYTVKMFLSHLHHVMYFDLMGVAPIRPPIFNNPVLNSDNKHTKFIDVPNWPFVSDGKKLEELYKLN